MNQYRTTQHDQIIIFLTFIISCTIYLAGYTTYESTIVMILTFLIFGFNHFKLEFGVYHIATLQFCAYCLSTIFWARNYEMAIVKASTIFQDIVLMTVLYSFFVTRKNVDALLKIYMWTGYVVLFYALYYYGPLRALGLEGAGRLGTTFSNTNTMGMLLANTITIHFYFFMFKRKSGSILLTILALMFVAATQSRKAIVSLILGVTLLFILKNSKNIKTNLLPILRIILILIVVIVAVIIAAQSDLFSGVTERMEGMIASLTGEGKADYSASIRAAMRDLGWQQLRETPYFGIGMGNARLLAMENLGHDCYLHCNYAELAANGGIVGLTSFYGIYVYLFWKTIKYLQVERSSFIIITIMITRLITQWGMVSYYTKTEYYLLMVFFIHLKICQDKHPEIKK